jgi:hypothetical protein
VPGKGEQQRLVAKEKDHAAIEPVEKGGMNSVMHVDNSMENVVISTLKEGDPNNVEGGKAGKYKKMGRDRARVDEGVTPNASGKKRALKEDVARVHGEKKLKVAKLNDEAGLSEQPCKDQ